MTEDERYKQLQNEKQTALNEVNQTYDTLLKENTALSNNVNDYLNQYQTTQSGIYDSQLQREQEKADLGKKKAEEEFNKEAIASKNAYYDFTNPYGVQRELQVQQGLGNSGYSETVKSQAWAAQQNRTAQARATMNQAKLQFDEDMKDARLNNDVLKAQLALQTLQMKQDETLRAFNYRSEVAQNQLANKQNLSSEYNNRYNTIWNQINTEKQQQEAIRQWNAEQAENTRQFNEKMAYQRERDKVADSQWEREYALSQQAANAKYSGGKTGDIDLGNEISTPYYKGEINPDTQYGTFSTTDRNGVRYQPNNVGGVPLHATQMKVGDFTEGAKGSTGADLSGQKLWSTGDKWYVWDGSQNQYIDVTQTVADYTARYPSQTKKFLVN